MEKIKIKPKKQFLEREEVVFELDDADYVMVMTMRELTSELKKLRMNNG